MQIEHHFVNFFRHQTDPVCVHCTVYTVQVCIRVCVCILHGSVQCAQSSADGSNTL